ncbi:MAG: hypothetical protein KAH04_06995 [Psychrilyobacter sp.]|nr:hypothetical protein [Psychrilyobacter sp.]
MRDRVLANKKKLIILGVILFLCFSGIIGLVYEHTFKYFYVVTSREYLDSSIEKSTNIFLTLSATKAFTAVIEGSEIGINAVGNFSIQVGDIVQSLYDTIDIMWKVSFLGVVSLSVQKIFLEYFPAILLSYMVGLSVLLYTPSLFFENYITSIMKKTSKFLIILFSSVYFILPLNIYMASKTSEYLNTKYRDPSLIKLQIETDKLSNISKELSELNKSTGKISESTPTKWYDLSGKISKSIDSYSNEIEVVFTNLKKIQVELKEITSEVLKVSVSIITIYITNAILLPFIFLGLSYLFIKVVFADNINIIIKKKKNEEIE